MKPAVYRPTTLRLASAHCPRAIDYYEEDRAAFRELYQEGIAAHECLASIGAWAVKHKRKPELGDIVALAESTTVVLIEKGRSFDGKPEPPMQPEAAFAGRDLAIQFATSERADWPEYAWVEQGLGFNSLWQSVGYSAQGVRFHLIPDLMAAIEDGDGETYSGRLALVRDYKSAWSTDASELQTLQMKAQALAASIFFSDVDGVRREVVNLRTGQVFREDIWLESGGRETLEGWKQDIGATMQALDAMRGPDGRRPLRPGAGCLSCPWAMSCEAPHPTAKEVPQMAQRLAQIEGERKELIAALKKALPETPARIEGGEVGWGSKPSRQAVPGAVAAAWALWQEYKGDLEGFLAALEPSLAGLEKVSVLIAKRALKDDRPPEWDSEQPPTKAELASMREVESATTEAILARFVATVGGREFGVRVRRG